MRSIILKDCIKGEPKFTLKDCLSYYEKNKLIHIANAQHMILNMGRPIKEENLKKQEVINSLATHISMNFQEDLFYLPPRELEFLTRVIATPFEAVDDIDYVDYYVLHSLGCIYLYNFNEHIYPVVPKELRKLYMQIPKKELVYKVNRSAYLYSYTMALTRLYGIYEVEQLVEVWNSHNRDILSFDEASTYLDMMYSRQNHFGYDYQYVVADYFQNNEGYELLDEIKDKPYYMPTKIEIELYSQGQFDTASPYYKKLEEFIISYGCISKVEDLIYDIANSCVLGQSFNKVMDILNAYKFIFNNEEELYIFVGIYTDLNNNTRKWHLRGFAS